MREPTVAAGAGSALMEFAISRGASRETLTARCHIDSTDLRDRDQRIPFSKYVALMRTGQELWRDPALALHFGASVPASELSLTCQVGARSRTMAAGLGPT